MMNQEQEWEFKNKNDEWFENLKSGRKKKEWWMENENRWIICCGRYDLHW